MIYGVIAVLYAIWQSDTIPPDWKTEFIIPVWKREETPSGLPHHCSITLLNVLGKVLAYLLLM